MDRGLKMAQGRLGIFFITSFLLFCCPGWSGERTQSSTEYVRVGYAAALFSEVDAKDAQLAIEVWTNELSKMLQLKPKACIITDYASVAPLIRKQELDLIALPALDYLAMRNRLDVEPVLVGVTNGRVGEEYVLLVNRKYNLSQANHLQGKIITVQTSHGTDTIPLLWLDTLLTKQGLPKSAAFFKQIKPVSKPSQAVLPVFFNKADACLVTRDAFNTMAELNPQIGESLMVIAGSPRYLRGLLAIRNSLNKAMKQKIIEGALNLSTYPRGGQILKLFLLHEVVPFQQTYLKNLEELALKSH